MRGDEAGRSQLYWFAWIHPCEKEIRGKWVAVNGRMKLYVSPAHGLNPGNWAQTHDVCA